MTIDLRFHVEWSHSWRMMLPVLAPMLVTKGIICDTQNYTVLALCLLHTSPTLTHIRTSITLESKETISLAILVKLAVELPIMNFFRKPNTTFSACMYMNTPVINKMHTHPCTYYVHNLRQKPNSTEIRTEPLHRLTRRRVEFW